MNKWVKWSALATAAASVVGGVAIAGYMMRYRPLGDPYWTAVSIDDYTLQYICVRMQEGRSPGDWADWVIVNEASCRNLQMDKSIGVLHTCRLEGTRQICETPHFGNPNIEDEEHKDPQELKPGTWVDE